MGRGLVLPLVTLLVAAGCTAPSHSITSPISSPGSPAQDFGRYLGAYRAPDGTEWVTNASGHLFNVRESSYRQMYPTALPDRFTIGPGYMIGQPAVATISFHMEGSRADSMRIVPTRGRPISARRLLFKETDVRIPADGAVLAGTITEPGTPGRRPGIVILHGSESGERFYYGIWVGLYASLGFSVLSYDKRGHGASTGTYPGEFASEAALETYASDAAVALRFLTSWPGVDPRRVGYHAGSQGGWTAPLAIVRDQAPAAFAILASAPAVTVDQQGVWANFSGSSTTLPSASEAQMEAAVRAASGGYDPRPILASVFQPILWLNGSTDRQVPTAINTEILRGFHRPKWALDVLPGVDHGLFENSSGLIPDDARSPGLATGLGETIAAWAATTAGSAALP